MQRFLRNSILVFGAALIVFSQGVTPVSAAAVSWDGEAGDGYWGNPLNWSTDVVPGAADDVTIDVNETINLTSPYSSPVAHFFMNDNAADTIVLDQVAGNNGTAQQNTSALTTAGVVNQALTFDGSADYVEVDSGLAIPTGDFTYATWMNLDTVNDEAIFMATENGSSDNELLVYVYNGALQVTINGVKYTTGVPITASTWTHLAITRKGGTLTVYKDGVNVYSVSSTTAVLDFGACPLLFGVDADSLCTGGLGNYLDGSLDDVRVYDAALAPFEVAALYNGGLGTETTNPVAFSGTINSLTLGVANAPVLNFDYDALTRGAFVLDDGNLTVGALAEMTHTAPENDVVVGSLYLDVQTGNADIDGSIDVSAKGFRTGYGEGAGENGNGAAGGGYGGEGGDASSAQGGNVYGSLTAPVDLGSGGGNYSGSYSRGGGAVHLSVAGSLDLDASALISANGSNASGLGSGGSGGSVYLDVGTLLGTGVIEANGATGYSTGFGDGGGGRIAIYYDADSSTILKTAYGGNKNGASSRFGGAGTIYLKDNAEAFGDMVIDNNSAYYAQDYYYGKTPLTTATYKNLTLAHIGHLKLDAGETLTYTNLSWTGGAITDNGGTLATITSGDLVIPEGTYLYVNANRTGGNAYNSVVVNGTLAHSKNKSAQLYDLTIETVGDLTVSATGEITADLLGYMVGYGPCAGVDGNTSGGAGNGGSGGDGTRGVGGDACGTAADPLDITTAIVQPDAIGSGGGNYSASYGNGGGAIHLTVGGILTNEGEITADANATNASGGGGAGGSIWIDADVLEGAGTVSVNGGSGRSDSKSYGDGGGGRIAIYYHTDNSTWTKEAFGGYAKAGTARFGGAGTIYLKDKVEVSGDMIIDNNGHEYADHDAYYGKTPLGTTTYKNLTLSNGGHIELPLGETIGYDVFSWVDSGITDNGGDLATITEGDVVVPEGSYLYVNADRVGADAYNSMTVNGTLGHSKNRTAQLYDLTIETVGDFTVSATGKVNADLLGYDVGSGPCKGADGNTSGGAGNGGSGGDGTRGAGGDVCGTAADPLDIATAIVQPDAIGSGGGSYSTSYGNGGGAIHLTVGGTLTNAGEITADANPTNNLGGGGAGGSIWIDADVLEGAGVVSVNGGTGRNDILNYGDGGGGRIAIYYHTDNSTWTKEAFGGYANNGTARFGGAGTIYLKDKAEVSGDMIIDNNGYEYPAKDHLHGKTEIPSATYKTLTIGHAGHLDLQNGVALSYTNLDWAGGFIEDNGGEISTVTSGDVVIPAGSKLLANTTRSLDSLTVDGTLLTSKNIDAELYKVNYTIAHNATVNAGGSIDVSGMGYSSAEGPGAGVDAGGWGTGAGHAGIGGVSGDAGSTGGVIYGSILTPDTIGSGGGNDGSYTGASGGGAVKLAVAGDLQLAGSVSADSNTYGASGYDWGGGSGGSIWLEVDGACSGDANLSANGSSAQEANAGAGAGGYILMLCGSRTWSGATSVAAGTIGQVASAGQVVVNVPPTTTIPTATPSMDGTGEVVISATIDDGDDNDVKLKVEYSLDSGVTWSKATLSEDPADRTVSFGAPSVENDDAYQIGQTTGIDTSAGVNTIEFVWLSATDEALADLSTVQVRITPADSYTDGPSSASVDFTIDNVAPTSLANLAGESSQTEVVLTWDAVTDTHFDHYEIWYGTDSSDVENRMGTATEWDDVSDPALGLATTVTTTLVDMDQGTDYYIKIWAIDTYGNESTLPGISTSTERRSSSSTYRPPVTPSISSLQISQSNGDVINNLSYNEWTRLSWESEGVVPFVNIFYSEDGGSTWIEMETWVVNVGGYDFLLPSSFGTELLFKVEGTDTATIVDSIQTGVIFMEVISEDKEEEVAEEPVEEEGEELDDQDEEEITEEENVDGEEEITEEENVTEEEGEENGEEQGNLPDEVPDSIGNDPREEVVVEPGDYIRNYESSTVYFIDKDYQRHPFWDTQIYFTWEESFSKVKFVSDAYLQTFTLKGPLMPNLGTVLVKIPGDPKVYTGMSDLDIRSVQTLHWIDDEELAAEMYGENWADYVIDLPEIVFERFMIGDSVRTLNFKAHDLSRMKKRKNLEEK